MPVAVMAILPESEIRKTFAKLNSLEKKVKRRVMPKIVRAGSKPYLDEMRRSVPKNRGNLRKSLTTKLKRYSNGTVVGVTGQKNAEYPKTEYRAHGGISSRGYAPPLHLAIGAVQPHAIPGRIRFGRQTAGKKLGKKAMTLPFGGFRKSVKHPGKRAKELIRPVYNRASGAAYSAAVAKAKTEVDMIARSEAVAVAEGGSY